MCREERNTDRRARPLAARLSVPRTRRDRRKKLSFNAPMSIVLLLLLAFLAEDELACIFDAFTLVGLRRSELPDLGGDLADLLLVDARNHDLRRLRADNLNTLRGGIGNIVAEAELKVEIGALHRGAVADARDLEPLVKALRYAGDQIGDESSPHAPHGAGFLGVLAHLDRDPALVELGHHGIGEHVLELALGALDLDLLAVHRGGDAAGNRNGLFANARHRSTFARARPRTRYRVFRRRHSRSARAH